MTSKRPSWSIDIATPIGSLTFLLNRVQGSKSAGPDEDVQTPPLAIGLELEGGSISGSASGRSFTSSVKGSRGAKP